MKRGIFSVLIIVVLALSFSLVTAVPVGAEGTHSESEPTWYFKGIVTDTVLMEHVTVVHDPDGLAGVDGNPNFMMLWGVETTEPGNAYAKTSEDGLTWSASQPLSVTFPAGSLVVPMNHPEVIYDREGFAQKKSDGAVHFKMWFYDFKVESYNWMRYAESADGINWQVFEDAPVEGETKPSVKNYVQFSGGSGNEVSVLYKRGGTGIIADDVDQEYVGYQCASGLVGISLDGAYFEKRTVLTSGGPTDVCREMVIAAETDAAQYHAWDDLPGTTPGDVTSWDSATGLSWASTEADNPPIEGAVWSDFCGAMCVVVVGDSYYMYDTIATDHLNVGLLIAPLETPTEVWVDDSWSSYENVDPGLLWQYDAFATIQEGINAVAPGSTVNVEAGAYNENLLIDKALTLTGTDGATETIIDGTSTYIVNIVHSDVTFEGFTVTNPENEGGGDISGILIGGWNCTPIPENVKILNNIVKQVRSETGTPSTFATTGINVGTSKNVVISGNTITDIKNPGDPVGSSASDHTCGINVWGDTLTGSSRNIVISNNIISDIKYNGIILEGAIDVQIGENDITGCESGVRVKPREGEISNVQIGENDITGCEYGISVVPEAFTLSGLTINLNNFADNLIQVFDGAEALDIQQVLGNNDFDRAVVIDREGGLLLHTIWSKIQGGIDAALSGDTINVAAGTYDEYVDIDIPLTLSGQPGAIVKPSMPNPGYPIIWTNADNVTVEGFEVDGTGLAPEVWAGIGTWTGFTNVTIQDNIVHGIRTVTATNNGLGIGLWRGDGNIYEDILIEGNTIYNTDRMGIYIGASRDNNATWLLSDNITIRDNDVYDTMLNATGETFPGGCGGIAVDAAKNCTIEGNTVYNTGTELNPMPGIFLAHGSGPGNVISGNEVYNQAYGIAVEVDRGDVDFGEDLKATPEVHFNNIYDNVQYGLTVLNAAEKVVDATNNWWGTKAGGLIEKMVSDNVSYDPWIGAGVKNSKSKKTAEGDDTVDVKDKTDTDVLKKGKGKPNITVTEYTDNPGDGAPGGFSSAGKYIDVHVDNITEVEEIEIRNYYTLDDIVGLNEESLRLSWWNGTAWIECSDSGATLLEGDPTYRGYVWAIIKATGTTPTLAELAGTAFMSMGTPVAVVGGGGGGGGIRWPPEGTTDVRGEVSSEGVFEEPVTAFSEDELCTLTIPEGTVGLTEDLEPLDEITMLIMDEPPSPPEDAHVIGLAYDFQPSSATFDPAITLTWSYEPADIPDGIAEEDLVIAYYDEVAGEWVELEGCVVDTENNTITAPVSHFTTFAIIGTVPPPPPPPAPAVFSVSNLSVKPTEVEPKETVTIRLSVANTGGTEGSYTVVLMINGVKEAEQSVTVAAGGSQDVSFSIAREDAASYSVVVDGLSGSFTVVAPTPPEEEEVVPEEVPVKPEINWPLIGGIIGGVIVVGLGIFFLVRRRAY